MRSRVWKSASLSATSAGVRRSGSSQAKAASLSAALLANDSFPCDPSALTTIGASGRRSRLKQSIQILVQLRQLIPAFADLVGDLVCAALDWEKVAYDRYKRLVLSPLID